MLYLLTAKLFKYFNESRNRGSIPSGAKIFYPHYRVQSVFRAHSASYRMGTASSFPEGKAAGA
jgi:hypothetical protein